MKWNKNLKRHAKIINKALYIKKYQDKIIIFEVSKLIEAYRYLKCGDESLIKLWINNSNTLKYDDIDIFPNHSLCPKNYFNLRIPF
jgi:hypothetical protein